MMGLFRYKLVRSIKIVFVVLAMVATILVLGSLYLLSYKVHTDASFKAAAVMKNSSLNHIQLLVNGINSNAQRIRNINEANVIFVKTYEFHDDFSGNALVEQLIQKAKAGAKIFVQFDVKGIDKYGESSWPIWWGNKNPLPLNLQKLLAAAPDQVFIFPTNAPFRYKELILNRFGCPIPLDHEKYLITWNSLRPETPVKVVLGGINIGNMYLQGGTHQNNSYAKVYESSGSYYDYPYRDTDIEIIGPLNQLIANRFYETAVFHSKNQNRYIKDNWLEKNQKGLLELKKIINLMQTESQKAFSVQKEADSLIHAGFLAKNIYHNEIEEFLIYQLNLVKPGQYVTFIAPYFLPSPRLQAALISSIHRGVKFRVLTNSVHSSEKSFSRVAKANRCRTRYLYSLVPEGSFEMYEYTNPPRFSGVHQKIWLFGQEALAIFAIGSSNLDSHSLRINSEDMVFMQSAEFKKSLEKEIESDFKANLVVKLTKNGLGSESLFTKFQECTQDWVLGNIL